MHHLIYGNQALLIKESVATLLQKQPSSEETPQELYHYDVAELLKGQDGLSSQELVEQFRLTCESPSLFAPNRTFHLSHLEKLKLPPGGKFKKGTKPNSRTQSPSQLLYYSVLHYLQQPPEGCSFILTAVASKETEISSPVLKAIKANGQIQKFVSYDNDNPTRWLVQRAQSKQLNLDVPTAQLMIELLGNDLSKLDQELEKLSLSYSGNIEPEQILSMTQSSRHSSIFRIMQALSSKNLGDALETLNQVLLESPNEHVKVFVLIYQQFRKLLMVQYYLAKRYSEQQIATQLKQHPFVAKQTIAQARHFQITELESILLSLWDLDLKIKFQSGVAKEMFQELFEQICLPKRSFQRR